MKKFLIPLSLFLISLLPSIQADEPITVDKVDFNSLRDDTIQVVIELSCDGDQTPGVSGHEKRFVENVKVSVYLAFVVDADARDFDYYFSELEIVMMEQGEDKNAYFYLPGVIVERYRYLDDPEFFYVEIAVGGEVLKPQKDAMSRNIPNLEILNSFKSRVISDGKDNEHKLMPIYLTNGSGINLGDVSDLPVFLRRDVSE